MTKKLLSKVLKTNNTFILSLRITVLLLGLVLPAGAADFGRPLSTEGATDVKASVFILDIDEVRTAGQNFDANVYIRLTWHDPRLAHKNPDIITRDLNDVWNPRVHILNQQKIWPTFPEVVDISPEGTVTYQQRYWGAFSQPLELHDFPFDTQVFTLQVGSVGYSPQEINLIVERGDRTGVAPKLSLADWVILKWSAESIAFAPSQKEASLAGILLSIEAERKSGYFIVKVILPLFLIVMMSWVVFWIDPQESGTQISVAITTMLTLIAYRFAVGSDLPKISYLSRLDYFILGATILVFASLIEVVFTSTYAKIGKIEHARRIDRWARVLFPLIFLAVALESLVFRYGL